MGRKIVPALPAHKTGKTVLQTFQKIALCANLLQPSRTKSNLFNRSFI
uniref:Uncharacterized protein n=1 Tax=Arundo donax TaxID=35708 RepID=A0A0A9ANP7_ARUDO